MSVLNTAFTPISALLGGALIGAAALLLYAGIGRIAGISGILNQALETQAPDARRERGWRLAFLFGLIAAAGVWSFAMNAAPQDGFPKPALIVAGLLVGIGTRLANGCTSGHGICGLSRLSKRSLVAVMVFMGCGFATVFAIRHLGVWP